MNKNNKKTIREKVEAILIDYPQTRNSDLELYIRYLQRFHCNTMTEQFVIRDVFERMGGNLAGITRERAHIQNKLKKYLSDKQIEAMRKEREEDKRFEYSPSNPGNF